MKRVLFALIVLSALVAATILERHRLIIFALAEDGPLPLLDRTDEGPR